MTFQRKLRFTKSFY